MIKNIIFDVGNVLVVWNPEAIVAKIFPGKDVQKTSNEIFHSETWKDFNRGLWTEQELLEIYQKSLGIPLPQLRRMMEEVCRSQLSIKGSVELLYKLNKRGFPLYILSDNTRVVFDYLMKRYEFFKIFKGVVLSCDVGVLKPDPAIYDHLLNSFHLAASECFFTDDLEKNVAGAQAKGMHGIVFKSPTQLEEDLRHFVDF